MPIPRSLRHYSEFPLIRWLALLSAGLCTIWLGGCAAPNEFQEVALNRSHAVLVVGPDRSLNARAPMVKRLNDQPVSPWRWMEAFRVPPGPTDVRLFLDTPPFDFPPLRFDAQARHRYEIQRVLNREGDFAELHDVTAEPGASHPLVRVERGGSNAY